MESTKSFVSRPAILQAEVAVPDYGLRPANKKVPAYAHERSPPPARPRRVSTRGSPGDGRADSTMLSLQSLKSSGVTAVPIVHTEMQFKRAMTKAFLKPEGRGLSKKRKKLSRLIGERREATVLKIQENVAKYNRQVAPDRLSLSIQVVGRKKALAGVPSPA